MREDDAAGGELPLAPADDQIARRARRLVRVVEDGLRQLRARPDGRGRVARVDEDDGAAAVEFGPDGLEVLVAEVLAAVRREERDAVGVKLVQGVRDGVDGAGHVRQAGQGAEEAELARLGGADGGGGVVPLAREGAAVGGRAGDFRAGGREGEDGGCDGEFGHEGGGGDEGPGLDGGAGYVAGCGEGGAVEGGQGVVVDVYFEGHYF